MLILMGVLVGFELACFIYYTPRAFLYWPAPILAVYGVLGYYFDESESTGARSWEWLRNWWRWTEVSYAYGHMEKEIRDGNGPRLFVVVGNTTNMGLISGFGLHGGELKKLNICYILPSLYFVIPGVREVLMWTGALSGTHLTDTILNVMKRGKSLGLSVDEGMNDVLFQFVKINKMPIVPVLFGREEERYTVYKSPIPRCPWFFHWVLDKHPPPHMTVDFLAIIHPEKFENLEEFNQTFNKYTSYDSGEVV